MANERAILHSIDAKSHARHVDAAIAALAERQHGVVARRQLVTLGLGRGAIASRLKRGLLHPVHSGAYAVGHRVLSQRGRWMAGVLSVGPDAVISHRSAARLLGLLPWSGGLTELTCPRALHSRPGIRLHRALLPADETTVFDGIPVTEVARTLFDIATIAEREQIEQAANEAEVRGLTSRLSVPHLLERYPGRRGSVAVRQIFDSGRAKRGVTRKELERRFKQILEATDLPLPRLNADLAVGGRFFNVDCLWQEQRLIVELDGRAVHGTQRAFEKDRERDRLLLVDGWRVTRVTWRQLCDDAPAIVADLRRLLRG
jgi:very-short-patch-repair endonuclease/predicted transcriptional regulator of viral defense system